MLLPQDVGGQGKIFENAPAHETTPLVGGPRFHKQEKNLPQDILKKIEAAHNNGWSSTLRNFTANQRNLALIILAVVGMGIVAAVLSVTLKSKGIDEGMMVQQQMEQIVQPQATTSLAMPAVSTSGTVKTFTQVAQAGEGVTHLARRAISQYLSETGRTLSAEQRIYAEDFLKDTAGGFALSMGQELIFAAADIETAYGQAMHLSDVQLANLTQFTTYVTFF